MLQPLCSRDEFGVHRVSEVKRGVRAYEGGDLVITSVWRVSVWRVL